MKIIKRDHSPINLNNEIHIKIDNNNGNDKKQTEKQFRESEEKALKRLNNMEYNNKAILMSSGNSQQPVKQPPEHFNQKTPQTTVEQVFNPPAQPKNLVETATKGVGEIFKPNNTTNPNDFTTGAPQTATVEFLDNEEEIMIDSKEFRDLPAAQQLLLLEDAKRRSKGRPKGSKNRPKKVTVEQEVQTEQAAQTEQIPFHSQFDNTGVSAIFESEKEQTLKTSDFKKTNPYVKFLSMNQVPPRPDRNVEL